MTTRIGCCIPGCRRTYPRLPDDDEVMCGRHMRMADTRLRERFKRIHKLDRKINRLADRKDIQANRGPDDWLRLMELYLRTRLRAWEHIKADVIPKTVLGAEDAPRSRKALS